MLSCKKTSGITDGHKWIDLGLSVKWATCNVGANAPWEYGGYYTWGEIKEKDNYYWNSHKWGHRGYQHSTAIFKYCTNDYYGIVDNKTVLESEDDVASMNWGSNWRMPSQKEFDELLSKCKWKWINQNGVNGHLVIGPNGNHIFLPASGHRINTDILGRDSCGYYWSATLDEYEVYYALGISFNKNEIYGFKHWFRYFGHTVRPVIK